MKTQSKDRGKDWRKAVSSQKNWQQWTVTSRNEENAKKDPPGFRLSEEVQFSLILDFDYPEH